MRILIVEDEPDLPPGLVGLALPLSGLSQALAGHPTADEEAVSAGLQAPRPERAATSRGAVFVPANGGRQRRVWTRSGVFEGAKDWSFDALLAAIRPGTDDEQIKSLYVAGILDDKGRLSKRYKSWGPAITMTPELESSRRPPRPGPPPDP